MKIAFYSSHPLEDKRNWSGTMYKMYEQILAHDFEVIWVKKIEFSEDEQQRVKSRESFFKRIFRRGYNSHVNSLKARLAARKLKNELSKIDFDVLFVPTFLNDIAFLNIKQPIVYLNDANVAQLLNYYPYYSGFGWFSKKETKWLERKALINNSLNIFSSEWAAEYAVNQYNIPSEKVEVLKFGANLITPDSYTFSKSLEEEIVFLFLAVDWKRKRGELAYESLKILKSKGYNVKFLIIGCNPEIKENWVEIIPFLNKNNSEELTIIQEKLSRSHFLFVPTLADCTPIAFCEAAGYGLPVISTDTGGVSAHVENEKTGTLLPAKAQAQDYASAIEIILSNPQLIKEYSLNARKKYETELNWNAWGKGFKELITKLKKT